MALTKPPVLPPWAESGDKVQPSNAEIQTGWPLSSIPPSRQRFNWLLNFLANGVRYLTRRGIPDYGPDETYMIGDRIVGDDGKTYRSVLDNNINNTPSTSPLWWERWGYGASELSAELNKLDYKASCRIASTANLASLSGLLTIDGITLVAGDRVLVKDQTTGSQNGIYIAAVGGWSRSTDADDGTKLTSGAIVPVEVGTANADTQWMLTTDGTITVGVTSLTFALNAGGNKFVKKAGDTLLGALSLFGGDTGTTAAQFDNSTKLATTGFVKSSGKTGSGITSSSVSTTLGASDIGGTFFIGGVSAGLTMTLPSASLANVRNGDIVTIVNTNSNAATVAANGSDTIYRGSGTVASFSLQPGDCAVFERQSATQWLLVSCVSNFGPLGAGQTWQNLTGSRALNTNYTNTTGKPMAVNVYWSAGAPAQINFVVAGATGDVAGNGSTGFCSSRVIVPPGATYNLSVASGSPTIGAWYELK
jgi:phage-related tail fiber protein